MNKIYRIALGLSVGLLLQAVSITKVQAQISSSTEETVQNVLNERILLVEDKISAAAGVPEGYYVIAGVYKNRQGALLMKESISNLGIKADIFTHPNNNMTYIYIENVYVSRGAAGNRILGLLRRPEFFNAKLWVLKVG
jgi:sporulation domain protein